MTTIYLKCTGANLSARVDGEITAGMRGIGVEISFDEAWQGLTPVLVVSCGETVRRMAVDASGHSSVPWECCISGERLTVGLCGLNDDGTVKLPTVWASCGRVRPSPEDVQAEEGSAPPTPELVEQITAMAYNAQTAARAVTEAAQRGEFDGRNGYTPQKGIDYFDGQNGVTPNIQIGTVATVPSGTPAAVRRRGTDASPVFDFDIPKGEKGADGVAVVLGDSLFESDNLFSFAGFLREKGIYREVINYAIGGCCFKHTDARYSLIDILQRADVQTDIARADEIWMHLGGNDAMGRIYQGGTEVELYHNISDCLATISNLNPDVLVRNVRSLPTPPEIANAAAQIEIADKAHTLTKAEIASICESAFTIDVALALSEMNIIECKANCAHTVYATVDGQHPTTIAAKAWFESIISAEFMGTRVLPYLLVWDNSISEMDWLIQNGKTDYTLTLCLVDSQTDDIAVIPMYSIGGKLTAKQLLTIGGELVSVSAEIADGHLSLSFAPLLPKKEWQLKGTITDSNKDNGITVDLTGCTELILYGYAEVTENTSIRFNNNNVLNNIFTTSRKAGYASFKDNGFALECIAAAQVANYSTKTMLSGTNIAYVWVDKRLSDINNIRFARSETVTSCDIKIYAR